MDNDERIIDIKTENTFSEGEDNLITEELPEKDCSVK